MTRRNLLRTVAAASVLASAETAPVIVPVHRVLNARARCTEEELRRFWWEIWPQTVREFDGCGVRFRTSDGPGEIRRSAGGSPVFIGLERRLLNLVLTDYIPMYWDHGRGLAGVTTLLHDGHHLSLIALRYAHGNQAPLVSLNTCVHEFLHALMQDVFVSSPSWLASDEREFRADAYATELWLSHGNGAIRRSAEAYVQRLLAAPAD